jgi:iron complex outermembrane receptor protein
VHAQEQDVGEIETIFVTGSAIRRIEGETSLPVQILDSAAIEQTGASSVVDLLQKLPTIQGGTSEITAIGAATFGFAGVSVHNVGENRTLVLLNGRRMAQFGGQTLTGFAAAVDLNSLPISSIERVEILSDGASALYGSDAIAGVVNFITKERTTEGDVTVEYYAPQDDARETGVNVSAGFGDYAEDGYNVFIALAADKRDELNAVDRDFADSAIVNFNHAGRRWTFFNGSPRNIPANATADNGVNAGQTISPYLLANGSCPENSAPVDLGCYFDYVPFIQIYPERERRSASVGLDVAVGDAHNAFVDVLWSRTEQVSKTAPVPGELLIEAGSPIFNEYLAPLRDENGEPFFVGDSVAPYRAADLGQRINEDQADFYHVTAGLEGLVFGWDYNFALTQSESDVKGDIAGYPGAIAFNNLLASGVINPFVGPGQQSEEGVAGLEAINYRGYWDGGVSRLQTAELHGFRSLFDLPNGNPVQLALGVSFYREKFQSKPSDFAQANLDDPVAGTPAAGGPGTGDQRFGDAAATIPYGADREVLGAFTEVVLEPIERLELTGSIRFDDYDDVGSTTNYKGSFKFTASDRFLVRGSYGTGFHAPTVPQLNASRQGFGVTASPYDCTAELQAIAASLGAICRPPQTQYDVFAAGNPELQPEESRQATFGVVFEPLSDLTVGADFWWVAIEDAFGQIDEGEAFGNPNAYIDSWTTFTDIGTGTTYLAYDQSNVNTGKEYYSGIDFNIQGSWDTGIGRLRSQLITTYMIRNDVQLQENGPYFDNIADYSSELDEVTFRWSGRLLTTLEAGAWNHTVTFNYKSGYRDILTTVDEIDEEGNFTGAFADVRLDVDPYYTFDWQSTWKATDALELTIGALNVFDEDPPLSLTAANFQIGYDARYYDPRGRVLFGQVSFNF